MAENNGSGERIENGSRHQPLFFLLLFGAVTLWALATGYFQIFSLFPPYDDEGYLMMTVKQFLNHRLYDEVYTQYGPVYYFYQWLIHGLTGLSVTHNVNRLTTLTVWTATSFLCGLFAKRLTGSVVSGAAAYLLTFLILFRTAYEPGHPQELCGLLLVCSLLLSTGKNSGFGFAVRIGLIGATLALLLLTKLNLGFFLGVALALAFVTLSRKNRLQRFVLIGLTLLASLLPFVLFRNHLSIGWLRLSILVAAGIISASLTSLLETDETLFSLKHYLIAAVSFALTALTVVTILLLQGTTLEALVYGVFLQHLAFGDNFFQAAPIQRFAHFWGIFALAVALAILVFKKKVPRETEIAIAILKFTFGFCAVLASFLNYTQFINVFVLLSFATPFLWLLLLNDDVRNGDGGTILPRVVLVLAAILQPLQIFPIIGTQTNYGSLLMLIVAVICMSDAFAELRILLPKSLGNPRLKTAFAVFAALLFIAYGGYRTFDVYRINRAQAPLRFSNSNLVRLPEEDFALYTFLAENLKANCDDFVSMPGLYSLNFWAQIEPPTTFNATAWPALLNNAQQQQTIDRLKMSLRACAVYHPQLTQNGLRGQKLESFSLAKFILENYAEAARTRDYRLLTDGRAANLTYWARMSASEPDVIEFALPAEENGQIARIQLYDWQRKQIPVDTQTGETLIFDSLNQRLNLPFDLSENAQNENRLRLKYSAQITNLPESDDLLLRVLDAEGKLLASLPFLSVKQ